MEALQGFVKEKCFFFFPSFFFVFHLVSHNTKDWRKFVEVLSSVGDKLNFAPSELGMISRVNRLLLDSVERLSGQGGRLVLLIFIAIWKATYVVLRSVIQLLVAALRAVMTISKQIGKMVADYLHSQIQALTATSETSSFFGTAVNAPPSIRKVKLRKKKCV